jgi:hypothetical protein
MTVFLPIRFRASPETHGHGCLALTGGSGGNGSHQDQLPVGPVGQLADIIERYLGLESSVGLEALLRDTQPFARDLQDRPHVRLLRNVDVSQCHQLVFL